MRKTNVTMQEVNVLNNRPKKWHKITSRFQKYTLKIDLEQDPNPTIAHVIRESPNQIDLSVSRNSVGYMFFIAPIMSCHIKMDYLKSVVPYLN